MLPISLTTFLLLFSDSIDFTLVKFNYIAYMYNMKYDATNIQYSYYAHETKKTFIPIIRYKVVLFSQNQWDISAGLNCGRGTFNEHVGHSMCIRERISTLPMNCIVV
jgi:hypothetical protein